jgi:hypothetical protein
MESVAVFKEGAEISNFIIAYTVMTANLQNVWLVLFEKAD